MIRPYERSPRLRLKRKDLAIVLACWGCGHSFPAAVDDVLINGEMPRCPHCALPMYVERATARTSVGL